MSKKSAFIINSFNDAGTGEKFTAGSIVEMSEGVFSNYAAGGVVREATDADTKAAKEPVTATEQPEDTNPAPAKAPAKATAKA